MGKLRLKDLAAIPPLTISPKTSLKEAERLFSLSGVQALVVEEGGKFCGLLERLVLDKALAFGLAETVLELLDPETPVLKAEAEVNPEILSKALLSPSSLAVIEENGRVIGSLSTKNCLLSGLTFPAPLKIAFKDLSDEVRAILFAAQRLAERLNTTAFLVGGAVRDHLLKRPVFDLDLVVCQQAEALAQELAKNLSGDVTARSLFGTYKIALPERKVIDVAQSRWEYYESPAALPKVNPGPLWHDLFRRDFTINAMALVLNGPLAGTVVDFFGGLYDLSAKRLRLHHVMSLVDDPTRIFRAARYLVRFALTPGKTFFVSLSLVHRYQILKRLSPARVQRELERILDEPAPERVLSLLFDFGVFDNLLGVETSSVREEVNALFSLTKGPSLTKRDLLEALALLFQRVSPNWLRLLEVSKPRAETLERGLHELETKIPFLLSGERLSRKVGLLEKVPPPVLLVLAVRFPLVKGLLRDYLVRLKTIRPKLRGEDLLRAGLKPGPEIGRILKRLKEAWLDGEVSSPEEEWALIKKEFPDVFP